MIKSLNYSVTFPTNGISLSGSYDFEPGLTAVTGGNGSGKTFGTIEMIRYMLFGKRALRGPASDYKSLKSVMTAEIAGEEYTVERTSKTESLKDRGGEIIAVGAEAVNAKLQKLLGMSLDVFDVVCAAVQKESDRLSKLQPAARKRLIDETVGLTANEQVEKDCKDEAKGLLREADALRSTLVVPVDPVIPAGYRPSDQVGVELESMKGTLARARELQKLVDAVGAEPVQPEAAEPDVVALERHEQKRLALVAEIASAERQLAALPLAEYTEEQLNSAEAFLEYKRDVAARGEKPKLDEAQINDWEDHHNRVALADKLGEVEVICPSCTTSFCPGHTRPVTPAGEWYSREGLQLQRAALARWATPVIVGLTTGFPELTATQIAAGRAALANAEQRAGLLVVTWQTVGDDRSTELADARQGQVQWRIFERDHNRWQERERAGAIAELELSKLPQVSEADVTVLNDSYVAARIYESQLEAWTRASAAYATALEDIEDRVRRADDYKLGAKRLAETRLKFKSHLVPTLSRIASSLIGQMTGGVLTSVIVDEDMNITVNGQDIATLSGAGSTVANLALRIALGQVLVRGVLPIFMADEADSDMEEARAEYTMECLANLNQQLRQIIVITHKPVKFTDQVLSLQSNHSPID